MSAITSVEILKSEPVGTFGGVAFRRISGKITGEVSSDEAVAGLREFAAGRAAVPYETTFDLTLPENPEAVRGVLVEANNRGMGILAGLLSDPAALRAAASSAVPNAAAFAGDGFLLEQHISLAHIQWQTQLAPGVPATAQGIGQVIVRDFGRWLGGDFLSTRNQVPVFEHRILGGVSQSAWFVNSFIAEGFNAGPSKGRGVYQGAFTRNGNGVVLAINRFAHGKTQFPYVQPDDAPLAPDQLLSRPASDPVVVDVSSLTDFYRVRAGLFAQAPGTAQLHRYATTAPHAPGGLMPPAALFENLKCNGGHVIPLSAVSDALYLRPLLLGLAGAIGLATTTQHALPAQAPFVLENAPSGIVNINRLGTTPIPIPRNAENGAPAGGIPMLESVLPQGLPGPPSVPPVGVSSVNDICGNFAGWRGFTVAELKARYRSRADYLEQAQQEAKKLVADGYLLERDKESALQQLAAQLPDEFE